MHMKKKKNIYGHVIIIDDIMNFDISRVKCCYKIEIYTYLHLYNWMYAKCSERYPNKDRGWRSRTRLRCSDRVVT